MPHSLVPLPNILVVEDDAFIQAILQQTLSEHFSVSLFTDGMDAFNYLQTGNLPDLILSDLNIPGLSGMELLHQVRNNGFFSAIPLVILSGKEDSETRIRCLEAGADDYIVKPFNPRELGARIKNIIRRMGKN